MVWDSTTLSSPAGEMPSSFPDSGWVHVVCVRDAENDLLSVYLNGYLLDEATDETIGDIANDGSLYIGNAPNWGNQLQGLVDELSFYNRALDADEVLELSQVYGFEDMTSSDNYNLSDLQVDGTTVDNFSVSTLAYQVILESDVTEVPEVTATTEDASATISINAADELPGKTYITVTAEDGSSIIYTVSFIYETSADADLTAITFSPSTDLSPTFSSDVTAYTATLPSGTTKVNVSVTTSDAGATVAGDGDIDVSSGSAKASIEVTSSDKSTTRTYTIEFSVTTAIASVSETNDLAYFDGVNDKLIISSPEEISQIQIYSIMGILVTNINSQICSSIDLNEFGLNKIIYLIKLCTNEGKTQILKIAK